MKSIILQINGGIGKCILATSVCQAIKTQYSDRELIVISGYPEVFLNNPNVKKSFSFGNVAYFYQDYIEGKDTMLFLHDPYLTTDYIKESKHLIQIWCDMLNIKYNGEQPQLFLTQREIETFQRQVNLDKPIMIIQTNGGADQNRKYSWARDLSISTTNKVIEHFKDEYAILHVRRDDQLGFNHTIKLSGSLREILAISLLSQKRLLIDSFMQHSMAALNLPSSVCWIVNKPEVLGYKLHNNIIANPYTTTPELRNSVFAKFNIGGEPLEFPYNSEDEIFNVDTIIDSLEN